MDFTARFTRGDESRTDGGSGLGLSIAKSFTEACGGTFEVETMADLFTVKVSFEQKSAMFDMETSSKVQYNKKLNHVYKERKYEDYNFTEKTCGYHAGYDGTVFEGYQLCGGWRSVCRDAGKQGI